MKSVSTSDLVLIPALSHFSQFDFLSPENDHVVNPFLYEMGFDLDFGLEYRCCYHRNLQKQCLTGYMIVGEVRTDREFMTSVWCTAEDKVIAAGKFDLSLAQELSRMSGIGVDYDNPYGLEMEEMNEFELDLSETERIEDELVALQAVLDNVRGDQFLRSGRRKKPHEYHQEEPYQKERKKKRNRTTLKHRHIEE